MEFVKGHSKIGGRKKGSRNKNTIAVCKVFEEVFERSGGVDAFVTWTEKSDSNLREFYKMYARLIPLDVQSSTGTISISINAKAKDV